MKNSFNLVFVAMLLIVLGCSCPDKLKEIAEKNQSNAPAANSTPFTANNAFNTSQPPAKKDELSMAKYNQIKNGMTYAQTVEIIGGEGAEVSSSEVGKYKTVTYKWDGENYAYIITTFQNDKLLFKSQANLK